MSEAEPRSASFARSSAEQSETSPALAEGFATAVPFEHFASGAGVAGAVAVAVAVAVAAEGGATPERAANAKMVPAPITSRNEAANEA